jgi:hypothetical protein
MCIKSADLPLICGSMPRYLPSLLFARSVPWVLLEPEDEAAWALDGQR